LSKELHILEVHIPEVFAVLEELLPQAEYLVNFEDLYGGLQLY
jgi:hypothetical protein